MPFPSWLQVPALTLGIAFLLGHALWAGTNARRAPTRAVRFEALGAVVPGTAGLLFAGALVAPWPALSLMLLAATVPTVLVGRACSELLLLRGAP